MKAVIGGGATLRVVSAKFCVPRSTSNKKTMRDRLNIEHNTSGRARALSEKEEAEVLQEAQQTIQFQARGRLAARST